MCDREVCGVVYFYEAMEGACCEATLWRLADFYNALRSHESYLAWPWLVLAECVR